MSKDRRPHESTPSRPTTRAASAIFEDGTLIELVYDARRRTTALARWRDGAWTVESHIDAATGERLVPFSPENNLIRNEVLLLPSSPEEYGSDEELLHAIQDFVHRYVDVSPLFERIASYYVLFSWIHDAFNELPYLRLRGDYGSGKTRFLLTVGSLCYKAFFASGASTVSPIFHTLDAFRGTLVIDEGDFRFSDEKAEIVKILNNGNAKGMPVLRTMMSPSKEFNPRAFQVFGPKLVATRGHYDDPALESRFITEEMGQRRLRVDIPINLPSSYKDEALALRNKLLLYRFRHRANVQIAERFADERIEPRLRQIFVPLMSVVADEGLRNELREVARRYHAEMVTDRGLDVEAQLLEIIRELFAQTDRSNVPLREITARFADRYGREWEQSITNRWVGSVLRKRLQLKTHKSHGIFVVPISERPKLELLYDRYGVDESSFSEQAGGSTDAVNLREWVDIGDFGDEQDGANRSGMA